MIINDSLLLILVKIDWLILSNYDIQTKLLLATTSIIHESDRKYSGWLMSLIECFHSRGQHVCKFIRTKESVCIRKEFNSQRIGLGHQHGRHFIVLGHQYGRRDVMWKHSIDSGSDRVLELIQTGRTFLWSFCKKLDICCLLPTCSDKIILKNFTYHIQS